MCVSTTLQKLSTREIHPRIILKIAFRYHPTINIIDNLSNFLEDLAIVKDRARRSSKSNPLPHLLSSFHSLSEESVPLSHDETPNFWKPRYVMSHVTLPRFTARLEKEREREGSAKSICAGE